MKPLTETEIEELLEESEPKHIREQYGDRLDTKALTYLEEVERELTATADRLDMIGVHLRESAPPPPQPGGQTEPNRPLPSWWLRGIRVPNFVFAAVAVGLLLFVIPWKNEDPISDPPQWLQMRGPSTQGTRAHYDRLFFLWLETGEQLVSLADKTDREELYKEAVVVFEKAHTLRNDDPRVLLHLIETFEKLGKKEKRIHYLKLLESLEK